MENVVSGFLEVAIKITVPPPKIARPEHDMLCFADRANGSFFGHIHSQINGWEIVTLILRLKGEPRAVRGKSLAGMPLGASRESRNF